MSPVLVHHDAANAFAFVHQVERGVDLGKRHRVGDHRIDCDFPLHVPFDDLRNVGAATGATEGGAAPYPAGYELERPRGNFLARAGNADDDALAPAAMAALQCRAHQADIADAFERIVGAADLIGTAFGHIDEMGDKVAADFFRVDEMRHAEALAPGFFLRIEIDANDHVGADHAQSLDDVQPDAAETEHDAFCARLNLRGVGHRADAGGDAAADIADLVERSVIADFRHRDFR